MEKSASTESTVASNYISFIHFPTEFPNPHAALLRYNQQGLPLKIAFRLLSIRKNDAGLTTHFWLACNHHKPHQG